MGLLWSWRTHRLLPGRLSGNRDDLVLGRVRNFLSAEGWQEAPQGLGQSSGGAIGERQVDVMPQLTIEPNRQRHGNMPGFRWDCEVLELDIIPCHAPLGRRCR